MKFKEKATIVPRPGVRAQQIVILNAEPFEASNRDEANLEAKINDEFSSPGEMGEISHVFRSNVSVDDLLRTITISTNTDFITDDEVEELISITEDELGATVSDWELRATIGRKSFGVDEA